MLPRWLVISRIRTIFLNIPAIVQKAGVELCDPLPELNAFTGCDTTSPFAGKGKKGPHKFCVNDKECHGSAREIICPRGINVQEK